MNLIKEHTVGNTFTSGDSKFTVLFRKGNLLLSEQRIEDELVAYEVASVSIRPFRTVKDGKWISTGDMVEQYPGAESFGEGYDKSFSPNSLKEAKEHFDSCI